MVLETGIVSLNKNGEELCGDRVEVNRDGGSVTMVLSDGLGSGVKANILSTLTSKILCTMITNGMDIEDAIQTVAQTLPVCSERHIAYSTFSVLHVENSGKALLVQYDNPSAIYLHRGNARDYPVRKYDVFGKSIRESRFTLGEGDEIVLFSDGVEYAGAGKVLNLGWRRENITDFIHENYDPERTARETANQLAGACRQLYIDEPGDDATVAVLRGRAPHTVNVMAGPPNNPADAPGMVKQFLESDGEKIVCGGTTSQIIADALHEEVVPELNYRSPDVPPTAKIKGIDLVTEGVLTIRRALSYVRRCAEPGEDGGNGYNGRDGASRLAKFLIARATNIRFFAGTAVNPAYRNPEFPQTLMEKPKLVQELAESLQKIGKTVSIQFY